MKKSILFLFYSFFLAINLHAQTVFAPPNSVWHFEENNDMGPSGRNYIKYQMVGDTVISGLIFSKIKGKMVSINLAKSKYDTVDIETEYTYTSGDTVFYFNNYYKRIYPLYIFNVNVGDTISYHIPYPPTAFADTIFKVLIKDVRKIVLDGEELRNILSTPIGVSYFGMNNLIEKIGVKDADVIGYRDHYGIPEHGNIRCYKDGLIDTNFDFMNRSCEFLEDISLIGEKNQNGEVIIFPNPSSKILSLNISNENHYAIIYDLRGKEIKCPQFISNDNLVLEISELLSSIYIVKLFTKEHINIKTFQFYKTNNL